MKVLVTILNIAIALYFFVMANIMFWGFIFGIVITTMQNKVISQNIYWFIANIILSPFMIYATVVFFRKAQQKYNYGIVMLVIVLFITEINRLFFRSGNKIGMTDLSNLLFFGIPIGLILLTKFLNGKHLLNK